MRHLPALRRRQCGHEREALCRDTAPGRVRRARSSRARCSRRRRVFFVFLLIVPLMVVLVFSFGERAPAGGYQPAFTFDNYLNLPRAAKPSSTR